MGVSGSGLAPLPSHALQAFRVRVRVGGGGGRWQWLRGVCSLWFLLSPSLALAQLLFLAFRAHKPRNQDLSGPYGRWLWELTDCVPSTSPSSSARSRNASVGDAESLTLRPYGVHSAGAIRSPCGRGCVGCGSGCSRRPLLCVGVGSPREAHQAGCSGPRGRVPAASRWPLGFGRVALAERSAGASRLPPRLILTFHSRRRREPPRVGPRPRPGHQVGDGGAPGVQGGRGARVALEPSWGHS